MRTRSLHGVRFGLKQFKGLDANSFTARCEVRVMTPDEGLCEPRALSLKAVRVVTLGARLHELDCGVARGSG